MFLLKNFDYLFVCARSSLQHSDLQFSLQPAAPWLQHVVFSSLAMD